MNKFIVLEEVSYKFGNKKNLYTILAVDRKQMYRINTIVGFFLPQYDRCPLGFIKDILSKKKLVRTKLTKYFLIIFRR